MSCSFLLLASVTSHVALAGDPDITSDFLLPPNATVVDGSFHSLACAWWSIQNHQKPSLSSELPSLSSELWWQNSLQSLLFHTYVSCWHCQSTSHSSRCCWVPLSVDDFLEVRFVDTMNKLYSQSFEPGDMFVFRGTCSLPVLQQLMPRDCYFCIWQCYCWDSVCLEVSLYLELTMISLQNLSGLTLQPFRW